jgi:DNA invertase Pin-like site-specific DNA recombinase
MKVAIYARVSTDEQELEHQIATCQRFCEYKQYEVAVVYSETGSGAKIKRPEYLKLVSELRQFKYDGVVVFRLDRLGRNARELALLIDELENKGIKVLSVNESFDTSTAMGRAMREIIYIFAQLEREQISEATTQRLASIKASGQRLGQKPCSDYQVEKVKELASQGLSCRKIASQMQLSKSAVYNIVHQKGYYSSNNKRVEK